MAELKLKRAGKGHKPEGAHGRAAVEAIGRTKTTGNFKKIEEAKGKGAAIAAYQNKLKAHQGGADHNGPRAHEGHNGLFYGAHEGHQALTSQSGRGCE
jgi:hypothetical protein